MDWFAGQGFDCWCVDMEGYGRSTKDRPINSDISNGSDDLAAATNYIFETRGIDAVHMYGISSGALRAALFAERYPDRVARLVLDAFVWTGEGSPTLEDRRKKLPEFKANLRRPINLDFVRSIFTRDHPGCAEDRVIEAFAEAITALDDSIPNGTYVDMCERLPLVDPEKITASCLITRGQWGRHRWLRRPHRVLQAAAQPRQAVQGDARHLACQLPAEELSDGLPHDPRLPDPARPGLCRVGEHPNFNKI